MNNKTSNKKTRRMPRILFAFLCFAVVLSVCVFARPELTETVGDVTCTTEPDGTVSTEIGSQDIVWLFDKSNGVTTWYGLENPNGMFRSGSRFFVRWVDSYEDREEYERYYALMDGECKRRTDSGHSLLFIFGVEDPDGIKYTSLDSPISLYVSLDGDFDRDEIDEIIAPDSDALDMTYCGRIECPEGELEFSQIEIKHFYDYLPVVKDGSQFASIFSEYSPWLLCAGAAVIAIVCVALFFFSKKREDGTYP